MKIAAGLGTISITELVAASVAAAAMFNTPMAGLFVFSLLTIWIIKK